MPVSNDAKKTGGQDEALAHEFAEYISLVADSVVRSQIKHDFSAIEQLIRTAKDELAPLQETVQQSAKIVSALNDVRSRVQKVSGELGGTLQTFVDHLDEKQRKTFEQNANSSLEKLSSAIDRLIKELKNETSRYLQGFSDAPVAMAELSNKMSCIVSDGTSAVKNEIEKASVDSSAAHGKEISTHSKEIITAIGTLEKSVQVEVEAEFKALKREIAQSQEKLLAAVQETNTTHQELFNRQNGCILDLAERLRQTDQRVHVMQKWIWGLGGSTLLALVILLIKIFR